MAKKKKKKIASRGSVNDTILKTLVGGDKYGYEIIKEVEEYSDGKIILKQPSLYSSLTRFEEKGVVRRRCVMCGAIYGEPEYCYTICKEEKK